MPDTKCTKCGKEATCSHEGNTGKGGIDYEYLYVLDCAHCGHHEEKTDIVAGEYHGDGKTTCPFCGEVS